MKDSSKMDYDFGDRLVGEDGHNISFSHLLELQKPFGLEEYSTDIIPTESTTYLPSDDEESDEAELDDKEFNNDDITGLNYQPSDATTWKHLVFRTLDEAYDFYCSYARSRGFTIKKSCVYRDSTNKKIKDANYMNFMCYREGFKRKTKPKADVADVSVKQCHKKADVGHVLVKQVHKRLETRTGCKARMRFKMAKEGYVIIKWIDDHTHPLIDSDKMHFLRMNRTINDEQKVVIAHHLEAGVPARSIFDVMARAAGGVTKLGFLRKDLKNHLFRIKQNSLKPGEATILQAWFRHQAFSRPGFYYDIQVDEEDAICSIFWADSVMQGDYALFGDFVSFDTTYRTNNEYRPLGALLYDESGPTFKWLFETFVKCMNNKTPVTFMTDQAPAIAVGVREVFPETFHALCSWHIKQNAAKRLGGRATEDFFDEFKHLIKHVDSEEQFEWSWKHMIEKCFSTRIESDMKWLNFIYTSRKQWSSAWVKDTFTAGKKTTQLSEQFNAFARFYLKPEYSISHLLAMFQYLVDDLRHNELMFDFLMQNTLVENRNPNSGLMLHAAEIFTPTMFDLIQKEFEACKIYMISPDHELKCGTTDVVRVKRYENQFTPNKVLLESEIVKMDLVNGSITCSCRFFENWGLICRHTLRVLDAYAAFGNAFCHRIPNMYVKQRWCREYKRSSTSIAEEVSLESERCKTFGERAKYLGGLISSACTRVGFNQSSYKVLSHYVLTGIRESEKTFHSESATTKPSRSECSFLPGEYVEGEFPYKLIKKRENPNKSTTRLMSNSEKRHLIWKQQRKHAIELQKQTRI